MIVWKDFILDENMGALLLVPDTVEVDCRKERPGQCSAGVMDDAKKIQETGQEKRLARMAGHSSLDSKPGMEAGRATDQVESFLRAKRGKA